MKNLRVGVSSSSAAAEKSANIRLINRRGFLAAGGVLAGAATGAFATLGAGAWRKHRHLALQVARPQPKLATAAQGLLNLIFHGIWGYQAWTAQDGSKWVTAATPDYSQNPIPHIYLAGSYGNEQPLPAGDYQFAHNSAIAPLTIESRKCLHIGYNGAGIPTNLQGRAYCSLQIPMTAAVGLRCRANASSMFLGTDASGNATDQSNLRGQYFPALTVLTYAIMNPTLLGLAGIPNPSTDPTYQNNQPASDPSGSVAVPISPTNGTIYNLHLFSSVSPNQAFASGAVFNHYQIMASMLGHDLPFDPTQMMGTVETDPHINAGEPINIPAGINLPQDEWSLDERSAQSGAGGQAEEEEVQQNGGPSANDDIPFVPWQSKPPSTCGGGLWNCDPSDPSCPCDIDPSACGGGC